jgi:hypothetical protein
MLSPQAFRLIAKAMTLSRPLCLEKAFSGVDHLYSALHKKTQLLFKAVRKRASDTARFAMHRA